MSRRPEPDRLLLAVLTPSTSVQRSDRIAGPLTAEKVLTDATNQAHTGSNERGGKSGMTEQELQRLGRRITERRRNKGLALRALAAKAGVDYTWLHRLEQGAIAEPDPAKVTMVLDALDLSGGRRLSTELAQRLPGMHTYFRTKYEMTPDQVERVARYVERLRREP